MPKKTKRRYRPLPVDSTFTDAAKWWRVTAARVRQWAARDDAFPGLRVSSAGRLIPAGSIPPAALPTGGARPGAGWKKGVPRKKTENISAA